MLATLLESRARSAKRRVALLTSAIVHSVVLLELVRMRAPVDIPTDDTVPAPLIFVEPQPERLSRRSTSQASTSTERAHEPSISLPSIDVQRSNPVIHEYGWPGPLVPAPRFDSAAGGHRDHGEPARAPMTVHTVDQPVEVIPGQRPPRYPSALERAGVSGAVTVQFVVDTTGHVEKGSITVLDATYPDFARSVRERLAEQRYFPARAGGRVVRQLVEQRFHFEVVRR